MLQLNFLYTGVPRGKRLVILISQKKAVMIAVKNLSGRRRWSKLRKWLAASPETFYRKHGGLSWSHSENDDDSRTEKDRGVRGCVDLTLRGSFRKTEPHQCAVRSVLDQLASSVPFSEELGVLA